MEKIRFGIFATLLVIVIGMVTFLHWGDIKDVVSHEQTNDVQIIDQTESIDELSVEDYLIMREDYKNSHIIDSVFRCMPEQILTYILVKKGTDLSIDEIVQEYLSNKELYDEEVKTAMDVQKKYIPDSIPKQNKPQEPTASPEEK